MEFRLENFEVSGLGYVQNSGEPQASRDYQLKIITGEGLAFHSSWKEGISDDKCRHVSWPDDICLECDAPLVGMHMIFEVLLRSGVNGESAAALVSGELLASMWDGLIDAIIGLPHTRDVVTHRDPESPFMTATTIVGVPMYAVAEAKHGLALDDHPIMLFIKISIKAVPLDSLDASAPPTPHYTAAEQAVERMQHQPVAPEAEQAAEEAQGNALSQSDELGEPIVDNTEGDSNEDEPREEEKEEESEEEDPPGPEVVDIVGSVESIRPFAPPPPRPPPPPPAPDSGSGPAEPLLTQPVLTSPGDELQSGVIAAVGATTAPPPPPPSEAPPQRAPSVSLPAPPPPPPPSTPATPAASTSASVKQPPPPPPDQPPAPAPPAAAAAGPDVLHLEAALSRAHAPHGRHGKSRASFTFVPSEREDFQGIPLVPATAAAVPPPPPPAEPQPERSAAALLTDSTDKTGDNPLIKQGEVMSAVLAPGGDMEQGKSDNSTVQPLSGSPGAEPSLPGSAADDGGDGDSGGDGGRSDGEPLAVDPSCADVALLQRMLRQVLDEHAATRTLLQAAEARAGELQQSLAMKEVEVRKLNKERVAAERAATAGREQLRKELLAKLGAAEAALKEREAALQAVTQQLDAQTAQLEEARALLSAGGPAASASNRSPGSERGTETRASITAASPGARIAHRRESLTAASVVQVIPSFPALKEESKANVVDASAGVADEASLPAQPQQHPLPQPDQQGGGGEVKRSASVPARRLSTSAARLFGGATDTGTADDDDAVEQVRPFEDSDLAPEPELEMAPLLTKRSKSKSVSERSQSLSQLDSSQRHLQEMLRAEMEKKTPKQRLRHLDSSEVELTEPTPRGTPQSQQQQEQHELEGDGKEHELGVLDEPLSLAPALGEGRRAHRERESAVELSQAAAQAAAASLAEDRRQRLLSQTGRRSDSPAGSATLDSLLMPIVRSNSGAVAQLSLSLSAARGERPPSVNSTTSSKSPMPGGRRMLGSLFRRQSRIDITDGGSVTGMSAAEDPAGGGSAVDEDEIASSIRDLNATFRFSPLPVSRQDSSLAGSSPQPSPADRVMQRMLDRRRSQMADEPRTPAGTLSGGSSATGAAAAPVSPLRENEGVGAAQSPLDAIPALVEPGEMAAAQRAVSPPTGGDASDPYQPRASVAFSVPGLPVGAGERKMTLQPRYGRARFSRTQSMVGAREGIIPTEGGGPGRDEGPGGSAESKAGSDSESHAQGAGSQVGSGPGWKAAAETVAVEEPSLPPHLLRKAMYPAQVPFSDSGGRGRGLHIHMSGWERDRDRDRDQDSDAELAEIDAAAQQDQREEHSTQPSWPGTGAANTAHTGPEYLYFPLELTQRDYLRRLFEILGDAVRGPLLQLFQTTEHAMGSAFPTTAVGDSIAPGHGGLFSSPVAVNHPTHRHSTGGHLPLPTPGTLHTADHHLSFPWQEAQRCDCVGLLAFLLDARFNFKLRPYICAKGTAIPSNDAYSALLRAAEDLTEAHTTGVSAVRAGSVVYVPQESGRLEEVPHLFSAARAIASTLSAAADRCAHTHAHSTGPALTEPAEPLSQSLRRLSDLQSQLDEHKQYKDRRLQAAGWTWDAPSDRSHRQSQAGTPLSPLASRPHSRAASDVANDHASRPVGGDSCSVTPAPPRRFSAIAPSRTDGSVSGPRRASVSRQGSASPNSLSLSAGASGEGVLTHLYRRSEATVAHLLVAVLPSNIAVIELMVCFNEIHELLRVYQEHHRRSGHREESQFLREFAEALEQQLDMDLSSIGAFKTSQQQQQVVGSGYAASVVSSQSTSTVGAYFSPQKTKGQGRVLGSPEKPASTLSGRLQLTQGIALSGADSAKKSHTPHSGGSGSKRLGQAGIDSEVLDQIYIELDELAAAVTAKESKGGVGGDSATTGASGPGVLKPQTSFGKTLVGAVPVLKPPAPSTQSQKDLKVAAERQAWSSLTAPVDGAAPAKEAIVRIQHRVQSGRYLLEHMRELVAASDELVTQLDDCRTALVAQRNRDYADVDREITKDQLRRSLNQEEKIGAVIKELTSLSAQVKHKLAPLHLTHNEELCALLSSRGLMGELANKLFSVSLTTVNAGHREHIAMCVATLLIRSKSVALVSSVFKNWPQLTITYAVVSTEPAPAESQDRFNSSLSLAGAGPTSPTATPAPALGRSLASGYKPPYSLDFTSPTPQRGKGSSTLLSPRNGGAGPSSASVTSARPQQQQQQQAVQVEYVTVPADSADVYGSLDFSSTRSLRLLGFTLTQMRHSKCFDLRELLAAGFPLSEVKNLKSTLSVNISAKDLRLAGYSAHECLNVGFDVASLRAGGFDDYSLVRSGLFNSAQLRAVGCDIQRIALMALFEALDGKHWRHKENWASATAPIGHWYGVHLDGAGHVYKIDLRHNGLKGMLPPALSLLTSLQQLDLYGNLITGDIPPEYGELVALRDLYLGNNPMSIDRAALHALLPHCKLRL